MVSSISRLVGHAHFAAGKAGNKWKNDVFATFLGTRHIFCITWVNNRPQWWCQKGCRNWYALLFLRYVTSMSFPYFLNIFCDRNYVDPSASFLLRLLITNYSRRENHLFFLTRRVSPAAASGRVATSLPHTWHSIYIVFSLYTNTYSQTNRVYTYNCVYFKFQ